LIEIKNINKTFGDRHVVNNVSFSFHPSQTNLIIGESGSGKTTVLKLMVGLHSLDSGQVLYDGKNFPSMNGDEKQEIRKQIGMLFQGGALFDSIPIWENVAFRLINQKKLDKKKARAIAIEKLKAVGLSEKVADLYPAELSGGMQKRASLARAIAADPEIIFFDEPTTGLDPIMADVINDLIISNSKQLGATTITITHDMASARKIADKIAMLYEGKIIWFGDVKNMDSSDNPYLDQFIHGRAEGPINFLAV
jgi:phospholipid/cholesterol/gamma-HCH transport system ATP-binding protein